MTTYVLARAVSKRVPCCPANNVMGRALNVYGGVVLDQRGKSLWDDGLMRTESQ
ncbi:MAG: hypothetical protein WCA85_20275 [Paraburkholderia sp.]|uniref:hypothetical protein n=1 Tax=Paraburkholderia sp. TaxID=1926495 RepID=UPI003C36A8C3